MRLYSFKGKKVYQNCSIKEFGLLKMEDKRKIEELELKLQKGESLTSEELNLLWECRLYGNREKN